MPEHDCRGHSAASMAHTPPRATCKERGRRLASALPRAGGGRELDCKTVSDLVILQTTMIRHEFFVAANRAILTLARPPLWRTQGPSACVASVTTIITTVYLRSFIRIIALGFSDSAMTICMNTQGYLILQFRHVRATCSGVMNLILATFRLRISINYKAWHIATSL